MAMTLVAALLLSSAAGVSQASTAVDPLVPPDVLAPADGASSEAGTAPTFRVRTEAGDDLLWVHISASPNPVGTCGTIDDDIGSIRLEPSAGDPAVYEATPTLFDTYSFWLNRPGTYYWQAYRIHYGSGADGCIEAPVRSLLVSGRRSIEVGPQPLEPGDGAVLAAGPVRFRVSAPPTAVQNYMWMRVSRSPQPVESGVIGLDAEIEPLTPTGDPTIWTAAPTYFSTPSFWMNAAGTYYWQPYRISYFGDPDGSVEGPIRSFTITAAPTTPTTPAAPTTVRGDVAFARGTANDLYLACTTLDLLLVDVLPSGATRVEVTGAADLRLKGKIVEILLDGRTVGSAVVGLDGSFAANVRAPARARRGSARYQARFGDTRSQNLKLERRMVAAKLTRNGDTFTLSGQVTKPFAKRPAAISVQRYSSCRRKDAVRTVRTVRPTRTGRFSVSFGGPAGSATALMYRAWTKVASRSGGAATKATYTLPRAINVK